MKQKLKLSQVDAKLLVLAEVELKTASDGMVTRTCYRNGVVLG